MKNKIMILTGAGSLIPWTKSVTSKGLTDEICKLEICDKIYKELLKKKEIVDISKGFEHFNFEDIINTIETFYWFFRNKAENNINDMSFFECPSFINDEVYGDTDLKKSCYFANAIKAIIEKIISKILYYDCTDISSKCYTKNLKDLFGLLEKNKFVNRIYTTNYDRLIPKALDKSIFEGYSDTISAMGINPRKFDIYQILESNKHCYYNLHGSIYYNWHHKPVYSGKSEHSQFYYSDDYFKYDPYNANIDFFQHSNPKEQFLLSPIITGFRKIQRTNIEPFNAINTSFYMDCLKADIFLIIGFSFRDSQINNILHTAFCENNNLKRVIIIDKDADPYNGFLKNKFEFPKLFSKSNHDTVSNFENVNVNWFSSPDKIVFSYFKGFEEFLKNSNEWEMIFK